MVVIKIMDKVIVLAAIVGIVVLDSIALMQGINGVLFTIAIIAISGLGGYELRDVIKMMKGGKPPSTTALA